MDQSIRNKLRNVVTQCRKLLEEAVTQVLQGQFGISASGKKDEVHVEDESSLKLSAEDQCCRRDLVAHMGHIQALGYKANDALAQLVREIAFTHLNRLCAYKMMEARGVWIGGKPFREAVSRGMKSQGFQFYLADDDHKEDKKLFDTGHQDVAYRHFLGWLGALLSGEIGVLFSPTDPANRLFPPQRVLDEVLALLNSDELKDIWVEDETIGWVYQYFTPKELRDQVRKESAAPRNSYELAFRNQFFTPRYVVEFLTDNTLGRIWYEMRKGDTNLKDQCRYMVRRPSELFLAEGQSPPEPTQNQEQLSQQDLLQQPVHIPHRAKKDPRELRILDPACGSGHFLLYCFDLLLTIYEEAYADSDLTPRLQEDYKSLDALRRDVPRLILAHNLHGIDIDLRATQIAALALWLRCQRAYREMGLKQDRPKITKSTIVCAEPMPGEDEMLTEFVADLQPRVLGHLVEVVFDKMKLAGEAGSLLKIEGELRDAIADVKKKWVAETEQATDRKGQPLLFTVAEMDRLSKKTPQPQLFDFSEITDEQFWDEAESQVLAALRNYSAHAANGGKLKKQLFAEDAERGFAFIDLCQKRFDVVLMNPPFGSPTKSTGAVFATSFGDASIDLYTMFVARTLGLTNADGLVGCITSRTALFATDFESYRRQTLKGQSLIHCLADLGYGVLDAAVVETAAYTLSPSASAATHQCFFYLLSERQKESVLQLSIRSLGSNQPDLSKCFVCSSDAFTAIPSLPLAYWLPQQFFALFRRCRSTASQGITVKQGLATGDDFRFLRLAWEVPSVEIGRSRKWVTYAKGGEYSPVVEDLHLLVLWDSNGREIVTFVDEKGNQRSRPRGGDYYHRPGLTYSMRTTSSFSPRIMPGECIFSVPGHAVFCDSKATLLAYTGLAYTRVFRELLDVCLGGGDVSVAGSAARCYYPTVLHNLPAPSLDKLSEVARHVQEWWQDRCLAELTDETNRLFSGIGDPRRQSLCEMTLDRRRTMLAFSVKDIHRFEEIETEVNKEYGLKEPDVVYLENQQGPNLVRLPMLNDDATQRVQELWAEDEQALVELCGQTFGFSRFVVKKNYISSRKLETLCLLLNCNPQSLADCVQHVVPSQRETQAVALDVVSVSIGVVFGRWNVQKAFSYCTRDVLPDPFAPLPACPLASLDGQNAFDGQILEKGVPLRIDLNGIIPDDADHADDIVRRVREVLELIWRDRADAIENEACEILGVKQLRDYFRKPGKGGFWDDHVSRYSKSRRKAPIYWLLQSSKKNYALWLYYHRLDKDILFKARQNYVDPKIRLEQTRLNSLRAQKTTLGADAKGAKKIDKEIDCQETLLAELKDFAEKLERAAKLNFGDPEKLNSDVVYAPDLNDGVVLNIAPLWELAPWKEAKKYWEELLDGKYEWSSMGKLLRKKGLVK